MPEDVEFTSDKRFVRRARVLTNIKVMVRLYYRGHDHPNRAPLTASRVTWRKASPGIPL